MTVGYIPQIFYDLIGRIVPGAVISGSAFLLLDDPKSALLNAVTWSDGTSNQLAPALVILLVGLVIAYTVGTLLGGIWFTLSKLFKKKSAIPAEAEDPDVDKNTVKIPRPEIIFKNGKAIVPDKWISYIYDYIQMRCPRTAGRIAKLRAEWHMCGVIIVGSAILFLLNLYKLFTDFTTASLYFEIGLALAFFAAYSLSSHVKNRRLAVLGNVWFLSSSGFAKEE
jgi:hypothetical protein